MSAINKLINELIEEKVTVLRFNGNITDETITPKKAERLVLKCEKVFVNDGKLIVQMPTAWYEFHNTKLASLAE